MKNKKKRKSMLCYVRCGEKKIETNDRDYFPSRSPTFFYAALNIISRDTKCESNAFCFGFSAVRVPSSSS